MNRLHVHMSVPDIEKAINFYTTLFGQNPETSKHDYAKWMLDDPQVNFAITKSTSKFGVNHLGLQVDTDEAVDAIQSRLEAADLKGVEEKDTNCCYANSNKYWAIDPAGIPWEQFHTLSDVPTFGETPDAATCGCAPAAAGPASSGCCT